MTSRGRARGRGRQSDVRQFVRKLRSNSSSASESVEPEVEMPETEGSKSIPDMILNLTKSVENLETTFKSEIQTIKSEITKNTDSIRAELSELRLKFEDNIPRIEFIEAKVKDVEDYALKMERKYEEQITNLRQELLLKEIHDRKRNLLFYGIEESENSLLDTEGVIRNFLVNTLELQEDLVKDMIFAAVHRLRKPVVSLPGKEKAPRAIIVVFVKQKERDLVLKVAQDKLRLIRGKSVITDLPVTMKQKRAKLNHVAYEIRKNESLKTRILVRGVDIILETMPKGMKGSWSRREIE